MGYVATKMQSTTRPSSVLEIRRHKPLHQQPGEKKKPKTTVIFNQNLVKTAACVLKMIIFFLSYTNDIQLHLAADIENGTFPAGKQ